MRRREFVTFAGGAAAAWPLAARAQQADRVRRIGVLMGVAEDAEGKARVKAFQEAIGKLGWAEGRNLRVEYRWAAGDANLVKSHAAKLVGIAPDLILANSTPVVAALMQLTATIPIVFAQVFDPLGSGLVASLARPGANVTGFTNFEFSMSGKWLEILKEIAPSVTRVAIIFNPDTATYAPSLLRPVEAAAAQFGIVLSTSPVRSAAEIDSASDTFARAGNGGLIVLPDAFTSAHLQRLVAVAARHRLPAVYPYRFFAAAGGLISYGADNLELYRAAAAYVDRILKGEKPGDLPIQQPTKYEFVINLNTAKALGLTVPPMLLARADEVIE